MIRSSHLLSILILVILSTAAGCQLTANTGQTSEDLIPRENPDSPNASYINGKWYTIDGQDSRFTERTLYSQNGLFSSEEPARIDTVIDLRGAYIVPPLGDAHNHAFADEYSVGFSKDLFLENGIFYALNLTNPYSGAVVVMDTISRPETIDVAYSHGGISAKKGSRPHPASVMERSYGYLSADTTTRWPLEGNAYWFMNSEEDFTDKWPQLMDQNPDVVKVYIMRYGEQDSDLPECGYGLCPNVLQMITDSAQAEGKRVFAHVNTAKDFQLALVSGVNAISHLPLGNDGLTINDAPPLTLADTTIRKAGEMGITLTPTAHLLSEDLKSFRTDTLSDIIALQRDQLQKLKEAGVTVALGADGWNDDPTREVMHLNAYDIFTNRELLKIWSYDTPKTVFPNRKIASFSDGYEASFVALGCDPTSEFTCIKNIKTLVKNGVMINID